MNVKRLCRAGIKYLFNSEYRFLMNCNFGMYNRLSDEEYVRRKFKVAMRKELDLENPETYNEKLQWLKLYNRKPEYTMMVDKYLVRNYVAETIGEEYLIPLLGVWDDPDEIDFDSLPDRFVLKCNHNSGLGMYICRDKSKMNVSKVKKELRKGLRQDYYLSGREWPYKDVPRKIIAEQYMEDAATKELRDYKFYCFNGQPKAIMIAKNRWKDAPSYFDYYDIDFNWLDMTWGNPRSPEKGEKPEKYEEMVDLARKLSVGIPHVRIDLYLANHRIYFGEMTFFDGSGLDPISPEKWDKAFGSWIELPQNKKA